MTMADLELAEWATLAKTITAEDRQRFEPPRDLWSRIEAEIGDTTTNGLDDDAIDNLLIGQADAQVVDLTQARNHRAKRGVRHQRRNLAAVAAAAALVFVIGLTLTGGESDTVYIAQATTADMPEPWSGEVTATVNASDGEVMLVSTNEFSSDEPVELWLIKPDLSDMHSLGLVELDGRETTVALPEGIDVTEFSIVDLSIEPDDGVPTHSGRSFVRGALEPL
ncbi:MAG: anti-sigma factor [Acidimicrobiales bacterium]|nr:MAG: anti-sigma factor [Acidimicrobiales bacterium]